MKHWQELKESPHYSRLHGSVELRHAKHSILLYLGITALCALMLMAAAAVTAEGSAIALAIIATVFVFLPFSAFYIYRIVMIFSHIDQYTFTEVLLDKPHTGSLRDTMCFSVTVKNRRGGDVETETHSIFTTRSSFGPHFDEYINQRVLIGYNSATEYVVVIGMASANNR